MSNEKNETKAKAVDPMMIAFGLFMQTVERDKDGNWRPKPVDQLPNPDLNSISAIAEHAGVTATSLAKRVRGFGIDTTIHQGKNATPLPTGDELVKLCEYYQIGNSLADTGKAFDLSAPRVREALVGAGVEIRSKGRTGMEKPPKATLHQLYDESGEAVTKTADLLYELEVKRLIEAGFDEDVAKTGAQRPSDSTVSNWLHEDGIRERETRQRYTKVAKGAPEFATCEASEILEWAEEVGFDLDGLDPDEDRAGVMIAAFQFMAENQS